MFTVINNDAHLLMLSLVSKELEKEIVIMLVHNPKKQLKDWNDEMDGKLTVIYIDFIP